MSIDHSSSTDDNRPDHPEHARAPQPEHTDRRDQPPAETRTRGEYGRSIRDDSASRSRETPADDKRDAPAERRGNDPAASDRPARAERDTRGRDQPAGVRTQPEVHDTRAGAPARAAEAPAQRTDSSHEAPAERPSPSGRDAPRGHGEDRGGTPSRQEHAARPDAEQAASRQEGVKQEQPRPPSRGDSAWQPVAADDVTASSKEPDGPDRAHAGSEDKTEVPEGREAGSRTGETRHEDLPSETRGDTHADPPARAAAAAQRTDSDHEAPTEPSPGPGHDVPGSRDEDRGGTRSYPEHAAKPDAEPVVSRQEGVKQDQARPPAQGDSVRQPPAADGAAVSSKEPDGVDRAHADMEGNTEVPKDSKAEPGTGEARHDDLPSETRGDEQAAARSTEHGLRSVPAETGEQSQAEGSDGAFPDVADKAQGRALYQDYVKEFQASQGESGWREGVNVVGERPSKSPGDISDLPPSGEKLLDLENPDASRMEKVRSMFDRDFEGVHDAADKIVTAVRIVLDKPPPIGPPIVAVDTRPAWVAQGVAHATPDAGSVVELGLVLGVVGSHAVNWSRHKVAEMRGKTDASHR